MSTPIKAFLAVFLTLLSASAQAQFLGPAWETQITLTQQDLEIIHATVTKQVHGKAVGTTLPWSNPASGNSGSIEMIKKLILNHQRCEELAYTIRSSGSASYSEHYHFTSCLQPDGTWKIA